MKGFNQPKAIYQQIAEQISERIMAGEWALGERILSIREMAVELGVNPNTVTRSYQALLNRRIIENQRGIGYFVSEQAKELIVNEIKQNFITEELPRFFGVMRQLGIGINELIELYENNNRKDNHEN